MDKEYRDLILTIWLTVSGGLSIAGFIIGSVDSGMNRTNEKCSYELVNSLSIKKCVDDSKSGCVYKSFASLTNPGYIIACELFRRRFNKEGIFK